MKQIVIYTDGACSGNPGAGGYAAVLEYNGYKKTVKGGEANTTNNRMELTAAIKALEALNEPCEVTVYSDSKYLIDAINKGWLYGWQKKGWKKSDGKAVLNVDLWEKILSMLSVHKVKFIWVEGHNGNEKNELCDKLAVEMSEKYKGNSV